MKSYSSAAVAIALGISEVSITEKFEGASILQLADNAKLSRYNEEADKIKRILDGVQKLEA